MPLEDVERFLRAGGSICPFARSCPLAWVEVSDAPANDRRVLLRAARAFSRTRFKAESPAWALIAVGPDSVTGFAATRAWAHEVFLGLWQGFAVAEVWTVAAAQLHVERVMRPELVDESAPRRPFLTFREHLLNCIAMAPVYATTHPRYAPAPIVVATWAVDVLAAQTDGAALRFIRAKMRQGFGELYDADALVLPLRP